MNSKGFTLIELMIAVAIIGIISAIAYPSYTEHVRKSRRAEVATLMYENSQILERWYSQNGSYGQILNGEYVGATLILQSPATGDPIYDIAIDTENTSAATFKLLATLNAETGGVMTGDTCDELSINELGVTEGDAAICWRR